MKPYIGIAGITMHQEAEAIARQFFRSGLHPRADGHQGLIGYCLTSRMIYGHDEVAPRYIRLGDLRILNKKQLSARNVIHYSPDPDSPDAFINDIFNIFLKSDIYESRACRMLQINRAFNVSPASLANIKDAEEGMLPELEIIFQAGPGRITDMKPDELIARLDPYSKNISAILLDSAYGTGRKMNVQSFAPYIKALEKAFPDKILVFAGGLNPGNVASQISALSQLAARPFSIDVESGVRDTGDELDLEKTEAFIRCAAEKLKKQDPAPRSPTPAML